MRAGTGKAMVALLSKTTRRLALTRAPLGEAPGHHWSDDDDGGAAGRPRTGHDPTRLARS